MPPELEADQLSSDASTQDGGTQEEQTTLQPGDDGYVEPNADEIAAQEAAEAEATAQAQAQAEADAAEEAAKATRREVTSPYATASDPLSFDADLRAELEGWLPESAVAKLDAHLNRVATTIAKAETAKYVQAYEQQAAMAAEIAVPPAYAADLKNFAHQVPENMRGTAEGAEIALMAGLYDRARREKTTVVAQMEKLAAAKQPNPQSKVPTSLATKVPVTALSPSARTSAAPVSGRAVVTARLGKPVDPLMAHFPFAQNL